MSDLFDTHTEVTQDACNEFAQEKTGGPVNAVGWQGHHSYTVESNIEQIIIQFRSKESSLDLETTALAKAIHGSLAPTTNLLGYMPNSEVYIWSMEKLPGIGFLYMIHDDDIQKKLNATMKSLAGFFAAAWKNAQVPSQDRYQSVHQECKKKLGQLSTAMPIPLRQYVEQSRTMLDELMHALPWTLTHDDLSSMNMLLNEETGQLEGVVDWAEAAIWPFGKALWGLEDLLGCGGSDGWVWLGDEHHRQLFCTTFSAEVGGLSTEQYRLIEGARVLGLLLRYGFDWEDGTAVPTNDTTSLNTFLGQPLFAP